MVYMVLASGLYKVYIDSSGCFGVGRMVAEATFFMVLF